MRILITGAAGFIGRNLSLSLASQGHEVIACVRAHHQNVANLPQLKSVHVDYTQTLTISDWLPHLENVDVVINAVGIIKESAQQRFDAIHTQAPCALFHACEQAGVKRVIQISALGADETAVSPYHLTKRKADECLQSLELDWIVLKPSVVYGPGSASMNFFKAMASLPIISLIDGGEQRIQPIHIDDLVTAVSQSVSREKAGNKSIEMVGPAVITMKELYQTLHAWLGKGKAHFFSIPTWLALITAELMGRLSSAPLSADAIKMLNKGNVADVKPFIDEFGFQPRSIVDVFRDVPALQADRWYAELYLLNPLLRFAIAFIWIYTGIVSAFIYPADKSYQMLSQVGLGSYWQPVTLYAASGLNFLLGIATLLSYRLVVIGIIQLLVIAVYTILISLSLPEYWLHPFGPISKNIPIMVSILIMMALAKR